MRYRAFDVVVMPLGSSHVLVHSRRTGVAKVLPLAKARQLLACRSFATLRHHAASLAQRGNEATSRPPAPQRMLARLTRWAGRNRSRAGAPQLDREQQSVKMQLAELAESGFLLSEEELRADLRTLAGRRRKQNGSPPGITSIGIPTRGRPHCLQRALQSYVDNGRQGGRDLAFVVADDTRRVHVQQQNREVVRRAKKDGVEVHLLGRQQRTDYAGLLAGQSGVPLEVVRFALLGDEQCAVTHGAPRNALLLHAAGEMCMQVDDDTVCNMVSVANGNGLALTSRSNVHELWFFSDHKAARNAVRFTSEDLCGIHERLLGKSLAHRLAEVGNEKEAVCIDEISPRFFKNMKGAAAGVAATFTGTLGDSGAQANWHVLFSQGSSYGRLTQTEAAYRMGISTRQVLKASTRPSISDGKYCMAGSIGLDNRMLLPPFMPVQRNEDGVFGHVLRACFQHAYSGHLPFAVVHDPPGQRNGGEQALFMRTNDIVIKMLETCESQWTQVDAAANLQKMGRFLIDVSTFSSADFTEMIRTLVTQSVGARIQYAERRLAEHGGQPAYWARDVQHHIMASQQAVMQKAFFAPCDLPGPFEARQALLQELTGQYGRLLVHWPAMVEAAKALREGGRELAVSL